VFLFGSSTCEGGDAGWITRSVKCMFRMQFFMKVQNLNTFILSRVEIDGLSNNVKRTVFALPVYPADVFANDS
jgi:hypothetical protein